MIMREEDIIESTTDDTGPKEQCLCELAEGRKVSHRRRNFGALLRQMSGVYYNSSTCPTYSLPVDFAVAELKLFRFCSFEDSP